MKIYLELNGAMRRFDGIEILNVEIDNPGKEEIAYLKAKIQEKNKEISDLMTYANKLEDGVKMIRTVNNQAGPGSRRTVENLCNEIANMEIGGK